MHEAVPNPLPTAPAEAPAGGPHAGGLPLVSVAAAGASQVDASLDQPLDQFIAQTQLDDLSDWSGDAQPSPLRLEDVMRREEEEAHRAELAAAEAARAAAEAARLEAERARAEAEAEAERKLREIELRSADLSLLEMRLAEAEERAGQAEKQAHTAITALAAVSRSPEPAAQPRAPEPRSADEIALLEMRLAEAEERASRAEKQAHTAITALAAVSRAPEPAVARAPEPRSADEIALLEMRLAEAEERAGRAEKQAHTAITALAAVSRGASDEAPGAGAAMRSHPEVARASDPFTHDLDFDAVPRVRDAIASRSATLAGRSHRRPLTDTLPGRPQLRALTATLTARLHRHGPASTVSRLVSGAIALVGLVAVCVLLLRDRSAPIEDAGGAPPAGVAERGAPSPAPGDGAPTATAPVPEPIVRSMLPAELRVTPLVDKPGDAPQARPRAKPERARRRPPGNQPESPPPGE